MGIRDLSPGITSLSAEESPGSLRDVPVAPGATTPVLGIVSGERPRLPAEGLVGQRLAQAAHAVVAARRAQLARAGVGLVLTNELGGLLRTWTADESTRAELESIGLLDGVDVTRAVPGRSGFDCLRARHPVLVSGPDHTREDIHHLGTAGSLITHPSNRRVIGSLTLVGPNAQITPLALAWVREIVDQIQEVFADTSSRADRAVMARYLREIRDSRHAIIILNEQTIVSNAAAARLIGVEEQTILWEHANRVLHGRAEAESTLELGSGRTLHVRCSPVHDGDSLAGVLLSLRRVHAVVADHGPVPTLPGIAGSSATWTQVLGQIFAAGRAPLFLVGERGTGKTSIARALAGSTRLTVIDGHDGDVALTAAVDRLREIARTEHSAVLLRRVDLMSASMRPRLARVAAELGSSVRLFATAWEDDPVVLAAEPLLEHFVNVVRIPPLRERPEDLPDLVRELTAAHIACHPATGPVSWMTDALQALRRVEWPGNVAMLQSVVSSVVDANRTGYISARDLPSELLTQTSRRRLDRLATAEAHTIVRALREVDGNKSLAADRLGISRSTLYRKIRSLGLDLGGTAY